ncbi:MAG: RluA family pseudouridine synthase [Pontiellaceae bacterium]
MLNLIYEDSYFLAVDKPSGILSVPGKGEDKRDCMLSRVQHKFSHTLLVHRLDMDTSGIMLFARSPEVQRELSMQFERRSIKKRYVALLEGELTDNQGEVQLPIRKDMTQSLPPRHIVDHQNGKSAHTKWSVIERYNNRTRVYLYPLTGRSHQLRVHMFEIGHSIIGDPIYGDAEERLMLHAERIILKHPIDEHMIELESPPPF